MSLPASNPNLIVSDTTPMTPVRAWRPFPRLMRKWMPPGNEFKRLRSLRNSFAPISILPPEVLSRIFRFLSLERPPCFKFQDLGWIKVTHVCRLWRQVALGDSSLWSRISGTPTKNRKLISEILSRSRNAPLYIDIGLSMTSNPELLLIFPSHFSHIRKLCLYNLSELHSDGLRSICSQEAPALEHFELGESDISPITFQELGGTTLFKGQAPKLRTFILFGVFIPWSLIPRGQLTHLDICSETEESLSDIPSPDDFNQLIDLLANSPDLEFLGIEWCLPFQLSQFIHDRTIHIPRLSFLRLFGTSSGITNFLRILKFPSSTKLSLICDSEKLSMPNNHLLLPVVSAHLQSPSPVEFKILNVTLTLGPQGGTLQVTASSYLPTPRIIHQIQDSETATDEEEFDLFFSRLPQLSDCIDVIRQACQTLPISNLEIFSICTPDACNTVNLVEELKSCTKITAIQVIGNAASSLVRALTTPTMNTTHGGKGKKKEPNSRDSAPVPAGEITASHAPSPIFPNLRLLSLERLDFANIDYSGVLFDVVQKGLRQRMGVYGPLKTLHIDECVIGTERAKALERLVQRFRWDGKESFDESQYYGSNSGKPAWWEGV